MIKRERCLVILFLFFQIFCATVAESKVDMKIVYGYHRGKGDATLPEPTDEHGCPLTQVTVDGCCSDKNLIYTYSGDKGCCPSANRMYAYSGEKICCTECNGERYDLNTKECGACCTSPSEMARFAGDEKCCAECTGGRVRTHWDQKAAGGYTVYPGCGNCCATQYDGVQYDDSPMTCCYNCRTGTRINQTGSHPCGTCCSGTSQITSRAGALSCCAFCSEDRRTYFNDHGTSATYYSDVCGYCCASQYQKVEFSGPPACCYGCNGYRISQTQAYPCGKCCSACGTGATRAWMDEHSGRPYTYYSISECGMCCASQYDTIKFGNAPSACCYHCRTGTRINQADNDPCGDCCSHGTQDIVVRSGKSECCASCSSGRRTYFNDHGTSATYYSNVCGYCCASQYEVVDHNGQPPACCYSCNGYRISQTDTYPCGKCCTNCAAGATRTWIWQYGGGGYSYYDTSDCGVCCAAQYDAVTFPGAAAACCNKCNGTRINQTVSEPCGTCQP